MADDVNFFELEARSEAARIEEVRRMGTKQSLETEARFGASAEVRKRNQLVKSEADRVHLGTSPEDVLSEEDARHFIEFLNFAKLRTWKKAEPIPRARPYQPAKSGIIRGIFIGQSNGVDSWQTKGYPVAWSKKPKSGGPDRDVFLCEDGKLRLYIPDYSSQSRNSRLESLPIDLDTGLALPLTFGRVESEVRSSIGGLSPLLPEGKMDWMTTATDHVEYKFIQEDSILPQLIRLSKQIARQ